MTETAEAEWEDSPQFRQLQELLEGESEWIIECRTIESGIMEFGAGPAHEPEPRGHFLPPKEPIKEWVQRKVPVTSQSRKMNGPIMEVSVRKRRMKDDEADKVADAIRWKIYHEGIEPQPFARPALNDLKANIATVVQDALESGEPVGHSIMEYVRERMRFYIDRNGTNDEGTMAREIYIVQEGG